MPEGCAISPLSRFVCLKSLIYIFLTAKDVFPYVLCVGLNANTNMIVGATVVSLVPKSNVSMANLTNINHIQVHMYHERALYASAFSFASGISLVSSKLQYLYVADSKVSASTEVARKR